MTLRICKNHVGGYKGQHNFHYIAEHNGKAVGSVEFVLWDNLICVSCIRSTVPRAGLDVLLLGTVQKDYPECGIDFGYVTESGAGLVAKLPLERIDNPEYLLTAERLKSVRETLARYSSIFEAQPSIEARRLLLESELGNWNDLHDQEFILEEELRGKRAFETHIDCAKLDFQALERSVVNAIKRSRDVHAQFCV